MKKREIITNQNTLKQISKRIYTNEWDKTFGILEANLDVEKMAGLSAIQVGINKCAFIAFFSNFASIRRFANARIVDQSDKSETAEEGCLSLPERKFKVDRWTEITVEDDINGRIRYSGKEARIIQHEIDHCNGVTIDMIGTEIK
jgi:peptide deformylase